MLKSSSEERIEMSVCETRSSVSYRSVTAVSAALWTVPLITTLRRNVNDIRRSSTVCCLIEFRVQATPLHQEFNLKRHWQKYEELRKYLAVDL
jgi:hypothetical protein